MVKYVEKATIRYRKLREITRKGKAIDYDYRKDAKKYDSDVYAFKKKLAARDKIEEMLEAKMLEEL